jgi:hypothetical protein
MCVGVMKDYNPKLRNLRASHTEFAPFMKISQCHRRPLTLKNGKGGERIFVEDIAGLDEILFLGSDIFCHLQSPFVSLYVLIFPLQCLKL